MSDTIQVFIERLRAEDGTELERMAREATTVGDLEAVAAEAGISLSGAALVKHFAKLVVESDDASAVKNFDSLCWDVGELLWILNNWKP
ncbi:hypothetical protein KBZ18_13720 [Synechococcus sp. Cruz-9H2]|uniref:hypothetical protein n=1 Tax=unclassified Synechococcus TaxID=2626047 RepID=UPI0020CC4DAA|nr:MULTISPECIES: hypothetical protein [unclassified Synechococcus]MCP9820541.1 hypothetical protein [Synechococcus sp. Cruz-9H2]MCP9844822.1 hypothetical protein [Synechococcus sp. Edmonson 11F2]MCP9856897.1 hypothetical protein [Synechococcus sp. Cruz-9C9]MCP9864183.1 hypothetical protein [Synechococcus sp. Cruz-7E5]MCP9871499.1 hypothetical protein [Synechococcus sp. Cruz-7B9]